MLTSVHPKLPMRDKTVTRNYYVEKLGFDILYSEAYADYLMLGKDQIECHFFLYKGLKPKKNYGQVYIRIKDIESYYSQLLKRQVAIHPNGPLEVKPWGQKEFSLLDPDNNLLTFGESVAVASNA